MIDQILKDHKPGDKPRFFLHDEMKAWLADNIELRILHSDNQSVDFDLQGKLGLSYTLPVGFGLQFQIKVAGELITSQGVNVSLVQYERAFKCLANVSENCIKAIQKLEAENAELKKRIDLIEKSLPV